MVDIVKYECTLGTPLPVVKIRRSSKITGNALDPNNMTFAFIDVL